MTMFAQGGVTFNSIILKNLIPYFIFYLLAALSLARQVCTEAWSYVYIKTLEICSKYELWGGGNKICSKIWHMQQTATNDPSLELYRDRLLYASVFLKQFDLEHKLKVKSGPFWGQGENWWGKNHWKKAIFSCSRIKIVSTTIILVWKLALKEYQRNKFTFSVKKDEEYVSSGQKQTNMGLHRRAHLGVHQNLFLTVLHSTLW